jgi:diguanylate cyclase (GGDEF)-like protein
MLVAMHGALLGRAYKLECDILTIGRSVQCDIQIDDENVSRNHAELALRDGIVYLRDLKSTNGTYVNSKKVSEAPLADGDLILIGAILFKYLLSASVENRFFDQMYALATTDFLTGTSNRQNLMNCLEQEFDRSFRYQRPLALILYDIDKFKEINDSFGHLAGDQLLMESCRIVTAQIREQDVYGRFGGDEFMIVCPETTIGQALPFANRLGLQVSQTSFSFKEKVLAFTISLGVAEFSRDMKSVTELIDRADAALYKAKQSGRNQIAT